MGSIEMAALNMSMHRANTGNCGAGTALAEKLPLPSPELGKRPDESVTTPIRKN